MALKETNKNRNKWIPLKDLAKKDSILDVMELERKWIPLKDLAKKETSVKE